MDQSELQEGAEHRHHQPGQHARPRAKDSDDHRYEEGLGVHGQGQQSAIQEEHEQRRSPNSRSKFTYLQQQCQSNLVSK